MLESANRELSRINDELESFAYVAAHDLKEPLRHIEAFAGLLTDLLQPAVDNRLSAMVDGIEASSRRLRALINDLAEYSRVGRQGRPMQVFDMNEVLTEVLADLKPMLQDTRAVVHFDNLPSLLCDSSQIRQLLQNLITNALKYRDKNRIPELRINCLIEDDTPPAAWRPNAGCVSPLPTTASDSTKSTASRSSNRFNVCTGRISTKARASVWRFAARSSIAMAGRSMRPARLGIGSVFTVTLPLRAVEHLSAQS